MTKEAVKALKGIYGELMEAYDNYKPDVQVIAVFDSEDAELMEEISYAKPASLEEYRDMVRKISGFLCEWFPDEEDQAVQDQLQNVLDRADRLVEETGEDEFRSKVQHAIDCLKSECSVPHVGITKGLIKLFIYQDPTYSLLKDEERILDEMTPRVHTKYPSVTAEDLYIQETIGEYEELYGCELSQTDRRHAYNAIQSFLSEHVSDIVMEAVN